MKKNLFFLIAMAATALLAASCTKEDKNPGNNDKPGVVRFTAQAAQVKTTIENGTGSERIVKWAVGDEIDIFWAEGSTTATAESAGVETTFAAVGTVPETTCYAVYPSGKASFSDNTLSVTVPAIQDGTFASANMALARTTDYAGRTLNFGNLCALVKFSVADASYTKAVFKGAKGETVAGTATVDFSTSPVTLSPVAPATQVEITLSGAGEYYFAVIPTTFPAGYSITLYRGDVADAPATVRNEKVLERAHVYNMEGLDGKGVRDYFATPSGAGKKTGKNWENAFGAAQLKAFIEQPTDGSAQIDAEAFYKAEVLDGATIHMAGGDYDFAGDAKIEFNGYGKQVVITFEGGYPSNLTGTSVSGRDTTTIRSALTSSVTGSIITLGNQTNITFDGITFKDAVRAANGGALSASAGESGNCSFTLTSCRFIKNTNNDSSTGAAVFISKASAVIDHSYFGGNYARNGACINLNAGDGTVSINDCLFYKNSTFNTSGCLQNGSTKTVTVTNCTFDHNTAGSYGGGAFHINASGASTTFSGCTFSNNTAGQGGAISVQIGSATFTNCSFSGNSATMGSNKNAGDNDSDVLGAFAGGAIILHNANSVCTLDGCTFTNNSAPNGSGGAIAYESVAATLNINAGTSFSGNTAYNLGGAIFVRGAGKLNITGTSSSKVTFTGDHTLATGNQYANGGAIWLGDKSQTTIEYAKFDGCEAGQEPSSGTIYYSNGGAISVKTVTSFSASNCEFTACRGRNGGCLNLEPASTSTVTINNCYFHDNIGRSGSGKDGTSGNFSGAVARLGSGAVAFSDCVFEKNIVNNASAVLHMNGENVVARFTDCQMIQNECVGNNVLIKLEKTGDKLYMNRCLIEGNCGNSRGMINPNANSLVYLNQVTFKDNYTKGSGSTWGVNIHAGAANVCMNNVTALGNYNSNGTQDSVVSFNSDGGWLITNCTLIDNTKTAIVRGKTRNMTVANSILINEHTAANVFVPQTAGKLTDCGHNVLSCTDNPTSSDALDSSDYTGVSKSTLGGTYSGNWTSKPYYGVYAWTNSLAGFEPATQTDVENAMKNSYPETDSSVTLDNGGANIGVDFYNWLNSIGALGKDGRGETRTGTWWPGAYQNN